MTDDYHKYIYDTERRIIVGDFEQAYANCTDVWPSQHDIHRQKFQWALWEAVKRKARVLDIGCGYGDFLQVLHLNGIEATGVEISPTAVKQGKERFPEIDIHTGDLRTGLPFPDQSYDIIILYGVFWFLLDAIDESLTELIRLLTPQGEVFISLSMPDDPIKKEILGSYQDLTEIVRRRFIVQEATTAYNFDHLQSGKPLTECSTDFTLRCSIKR